MSRTTLAPTRRSQRTAARNSTLVDAAIKVPDEALVLSTRGTAKRPMSRVYSDETKELFRAARKDGHRNVGALARHARENRRRHLGLGVEPKSRLLRDLPARLRRGKKGPESPDEHLDDSSSSREPTLLQEAPSETVDLIEGPIDLVAGRYHPKDSTEYTVSDTLNDRISQTVFNFKMEGVDSMPRSVMVAGQGPGRTTVDSTDTLSFQKLYDLRLSTPPAAPYFKTDLPHLRTMLLGFDKYTAAYQQAHEIVQGYNFSGGLPTFDHVGDSRGLRLDAPIDDTLVLRGNAWLQGVLCDRPNRLRGHRLAICCVAADGGKGLDRISRPFLYTHAISRPTLYSQALAHLQSAGIRSVSGTPPKVLATCHITIEIKIQAQ